MFTGMRVYRIVGGKLAEEWAHLIALACGAAPQGRERWSLRLLSDRLVSLPSRLLLVRIWSPAPKRL